jgi:asparagine synthetase B (glutamine-hydrolysing)
MPATIIDRPKIAVVDPQRDWLKGPLSEWVLDTISSASFAARGLFDIANVKKSYGNYQAQAENENSFHIWQWLGMELWYQEIIDSDPYVSVQNGPGPADAKRLAR